MGGRGERVARGVGKRALGRLGWQHGGAVVSRAAAKLARLSCPNCRHVHLPRVSELGCELTAPVVVWVKSICGGSCDAASLAAYIIVVLLPGFSPALVQRTPTQRHRLLELPGMSEHAATDGENGEDALVPELDDVMNAGSPLGPVAIAGDGFMGMTPPPPSPRTQPNIAASYVDPNIAV